MKSETPWSMHTIQPDLAWGRCRDCGHVQRITATDAELPHAPHCTRCGAPVLTPLNGKPIKRTSFRCPGCGGLFDYRDCHWALPVHLQSPDWTCKNTMLRRGYFIRFGYIYTLPASAHLKRMDTEVVLTACNPEGVEATIGRWASADRNLALEHLRALWPDSPQSPEAKQAADDEEAA